MSEIKCPKCHTVFTIDEADYNSIAKQIRDNEFNNENMNEFQNTNMNNQHLDGTNLKI